jgi:hypothetical protein
MSRDIFLVSGIGEDKLETISFTFGFFFFMHIGFLSGNRVKVRGLKKL